MAITTDRDKVRVKIGDTDSTDPLLYDDAIEYLLDEHDDNINRTAAAAARAIAAKFARGFNFATDGQSFNRAERVKHYLSLSAELLAEEAKTLATVPTTRQDGYSDDVAYDEFDSASGGPGRVRKGWFDFDLPI